ncbi:hypothetical protein NX059_009748 [Plenodomus lindquistii]|nr:hypothetical protein NX059_009748 [Plenodomus lindquistii]
MIHNHTENPSPFYPYPIIIPPTMATSPPDDKEDITPYSMHVSSRYLSLTKQKLELTRLPRELELPDTHRWTQGTPKSVLEPLLDFWLEGYEWRREEEGFNRVLPQFRTSVSVGVSVGVSGGVAGGGGGGEGGKRKGLRMGADVETGIGTGTGTGIDGKKDTEKEDLRIHFVHRPSSHAHAIPLLMCHTWPSSFIEVQRVIEGLAEPVGEEEEVQAFHVVAPSIPGFGFSDASMKEGFGVAGTAAVFDGLMGRLGYGGYVAVGTGWYV